MSKERASAYFLGRKGFGKLNCAQSVIAAFADRLGLPDDLISRFVTFGSGRAPQGDCGAFYALTYLLDTKTDDNLFEICRRNFMNWAGSTRCKEIRQLRRLSCAGCVERAAECVEMNLK